MCEDLLKLVKKYREKHEKMRKQAADDLFTAESQLERHTHRMVGAKNGHKVDVLDDILEEFDPEQW